MFKLKLFILAINLIAHEAAVIRTCDNKDNVKLNAQDSSDILTTTLEPTMTTTSVDQDLIDISSEKVTTRSRDDEAVILISDLTILESKPADLIKMKQNIIKNKKSEKLLLLSTPKIAEKPKQPEENLEESEEEIELFENVTEMAAETTTTSAEMTTILKADVNDITKNPLEIKDQSYWSTTEKITKLYAINDTLYADISKKKECNIEKVVVDDSSSSCTTFEQQIKDAINANYGAVVFEESESGFVLVESEFPQGSYTDVDSELHLQPIVQSVEIVPSSLDDSLFLNYVQSW